ncbi:MAG: type II secretion system F family protein [Nanoarchaeota archaeon]|nr:type II secretion system F family protein [Nanoarchaeota archaeon]
MNFGSGSSQSTQNFLRSYKRFSVAFFGGLTDKYIKNFEQLKPHIRGANIKMMLKTWVSMIFMSSVIVYIVSLISVTIASILLAFDTMTMISYILLVPLLAAAGTFILFYVYPIQKADSIKNSIDNNLPFALSHMSAIASSGIPPEYMFELITDFKEYGEISKQASMVVRNVKTFGMSSLNAIKDVAERTPSQNFKEILLGIAASIEKGGNLISYIDEMSKQQLFQYKIKREKYLTTLSTYADIYTALLVAAPLMMLAVLGVMGIIGGEIMGMTINDLIFFITWIGLPFLNVAFLMFVHMTYPGV